MTVYHRTSKNNAKKILKSAFFKETKGFYGIGVYVVSDLESTLTKYSKKHYGNTIVKCKLSNYSDFITFEKSEDAMEYGKKNCANGMIYSNKNDGNVVFIKSNKNIIPISYSTNNGESWKN